MTESLEEQHDRGALQYYVESARHAYPASPIPEFSEVLAVLDTYANEQTEGNRKRLRNVYDRLRGEEYARRFSGYTAAGQYREALIRVIANTLAGLKRVWMSDTFFFTEAVFCASHKPGINASYQQWLENNYQDDLWRRCFL